MKRRNILARLRQDEVWDVIVVGGGATGLGVAVDAATRGYSTLLLEAHDFAKGTSSRSTKLVHGGVRYLEQGDIPLVLEALRERGLLHQNAPHLVHHQSFIVPRYKWWEGPFFGIGLKLYDALAGRLNLAPSRILHREETLERIPNLEPDHLLGGVLYFDGQFDDARLAITLALTAESHGAALLNYCPVRKLVHEGGLVHGVVAEDLETGKEMHLRARVVVNATGIFTDSIRTLDDSSCAPTVRPSQGVHIVLDSHFLQGEDAIMVPHTDDGRVLFVIPWHGKVLVGTTDTPVSEPELEPRALEDEIGFILRNAAGYLARDPGPGDIRSVFAGQRPLVSRPAADGKATKSISRNHEVFGSDSGLVTIAGGKWTTYRQMAEDTVDHCIGIGGLEERKCVTTHLKLFGFSSENSKTDPMNSYGSERAVLERLAQEDRELGKPLVEGFEYTRACVVHALRSEWARTLEDILARRTRLLLLDATAAIQAAPEIAKLMSQELGRDGEWATSQVEQFREVAQHYLHRPAAEH